MKDAFYFPHDYDARTDEKMVRLIRDCKWEGYGLYWAIIEKLHQAGGELQLDCDGIAYDLRSDVELITKIIKNYQLFTVKSEKFTSLRVKQNLAHRIIKSEKARLSARKRWGYENSERNATEMRSQCDANAKRKGKERKGNILQNNPPKEVGLEQPVKSVRATLIHVFCEAYQKNRGHKLIITNGKKDGSLMKKLEDSVGYDEVVRRIKAFFESDDKFIKTTDYGMGVFYSQINKLAATTSAPWDGR